MTAEPLPDDPQLGPLLATFRPISLRGLEARAALMDREDRKYVVPQDVLATVLERLRDEVEVLEVEGRRRSRYASTYFDTPDADLFRAHAQGRRLRYKVRTREYSDLGTRYVEVKLKGSRGRTVKLRQAFSTAEHGEGGTGVQAFADRTVSAAYGLPPQPRLLPSLSVGYDRSTLVAREGELRVTVDSALTFRRPDGTRVGTLKPGLLLVEVKSPAGRSGVDALLVRNGCRPQSFSKYGLGLGLGLARPDVPVADLRWAVRRYLDVHRANPWDAAAG